MFLFLPHSSADVIPAPAADAAPILAYAYPRALHLTHRVGCRVGARGPPPQPDLGAGHRIEGFRLPICSPSLTYDHVAFTV
jgi:hypothetical protein